MGMLNDSERGSLDATAEEGLPLYSNLDFEDAAAVELPEENAPPDVVREFLMRLFAQRKIPADHARRVVSKWNLGSGRELRSYPPAMYLSIFGQEDGWVLYKDVYVARAASKRRKGGFAQHHAGSIAAGVLLVWNLLMILIVSTLTDPVAVVVGAAAGLLFGGAALFIVLVVQFVVKKSPEQEAEAMLATVSGTGDSQRTRSEANAL